MNKFMNLVAVASMLDIDFIKIVDDAANDRPIHPNPDHYKLSATLEEQNRYKKAQHIEREYRPLKASLGDMIRYKQSK